MNTQLQHDYDQDIADRLSAKLIQSIYYSTLNLDYSKKIMRAQLSGKVVLPHGLGLDQESYKALRKAVDDIEIVHQELEWHKDDWAFIRERASLCEALFSFKSEERNELIELLCTYRNKQDPSSKEMATILATACLANYHLWDSLGLQDRSQLGDLIKYNFPELHALNTDNMRWKRFFYLQLCKQGGDYICRAPSCEECKSHTECFA